MVNVIFFWPVMLWGYIALRLEGFVRILMGEMTFKEFMDEIGF